MLAFKVWMVNQHGVEDYRVLYSERDIGAVLHSHESSLYTFVGLNYRELRKIADFMEDRVIERLAAAREHRPMRSWKPKRRKQ
jgi:hypothetical protein